MNAFEENKFVELINKIPNVAVQGYNKERIVIYWNKASESIYGYTKDEAIGQKLEDLIIPNFMKDDVKEAIKNWYEAGQEIPSGKLPLKHKDGSTIHVYSSHVMLRQNTTSPEMFCIDVDLSAEVKKDEELKKKDELLAHKSKMASMGEMLDNIAHQWRQPLSMISCIAAGIQFENEFNKLTDKYLNKSIDSIVDTTKYLSQTVDDFRDFMKGTHEKVNFDLLDNLKFSLKLLDPQIKKNRLNIILTTPYEEFKINGYPNELVQVIINIISNAKDAFIERSIAERYIFINVKKKKEMAIIEIKDNAGGIKEEYLQKIFEPYFTTKGEIDGSGIGLYMSKNLITQSMKGTLSVKNEKYLYENISYGGAKFKIEIPLDL